MEDLEYRHRGESGGLASWRHRGGIVAALAFGAWKRSHEAAKPYTGDGFYEIVDDVGFIPKANQKWHAHAEVEGRKIFDVVYSISPDHFRVVPTAADNPDACVLVFGDSFSFGTGVADDKTFAAQIVKRSGHRVAVHNLAGSDQWCAECLGY